MVALAAAVAASIALVGPAPGTGAAAAASAVPAMPTAQVPAPPIATQTATTPPSTAQMIDGQVTVSVDSLAPEVITAGQDLTISGTIANGTDKALEGLSLTAQMQDSTEMAVTGMESWLAAERDSAMREVYSGDFGESITPGEVKPFSVTINADDLPLDEEAQWGPRGVEVSVFQGRSAVAQDRTLLVWDTGGAASRSRVTALVPVTASADDLELLTTGAEPPTDAALADLRKRIASLLSLAGDGVVLAVDPALLDALGVNEDTLAAAKPSPEPSAGPSAAGEESPAATSSSTPSAPATGPSPTGPSAPPTPSAPSTPSATASPTAPGSQPGKTLPGQALTKALLEALDAGDVVALPWADADVAALTHQEETDLLADVQKRAEESRTAEVGAPTSLTWLAGSLDAATLSALPDSTQTIVTTPGDLPVEEDLTYTPSEVTSVGSRTVLTPDKNLSDTLGGTLTTDESSTDLSNLDTI